MRQEEFKQLNQFDRIEYLLRIKRLEERTETSLLAPWIAIAFIIVSQIFLLLSYLTFKTSSFFVSLLYAELRVFRLGLVMMILLMVLEIITNYFMIYRRSKWRKELDNEFLIKNATNKNKSKDSRRH